MPFLATFMQCQIFFPILAFHKVAKIGKTCLLKVAKNGNFRCYYRFAIIGNICSSSKSSQMTTALPYIPLANGIGCQNWQMLSFSKISNCYQLPKFHQLPKLANVIGCQIWQILRTQKLPKLASIISCQNWQMLSFSKIGKCYRLPKLANFEDTKVAKIGKYHQLPNLANVVGCQNWQILKTPKLPKLAFEHTCHRQSHDCYIQLS